MSSELKLTNIKHPSSGSNNLVLASDGNVSITNTLSAGTLGANVVFNDAHKDIRKDDYILLGFADSTDFNSDGDLVGSSSDLWNEAYKGSGITHPYHPTSTADYGRFKVSKAGIYLIWFNMHNNNNTDDQNEVYLVRNGLYLNTGSLTDPAGNRGGRSFLVGASEIQYPDSGAKIFVIPLVANDFLNLYGQGNFYGEAVAPMSQFGAIRLGDRI